MSRKAAEKGQDAEEKGQKKTRRLEGGSAYFAGYSRKNGNVHRPYVFMISSATRRREMQRSIACFSI